MANTTRAASVYLHGDFPEGAVVLVRRLEDLLGGAVEKSVHGTITCFAINKPKENYDAVADPPPYVDPDRGHGRGAEGVGSVR